MQHEISDRCSIAAFIKKTIARGFDCLHTLDLDLKNETPDNVINFISVSEQRIIITKDTDFFNSLILKQQPR